VSDLETYLRSAAKNGLLSVNVARDWDGKNWTVTIRNTDNTTIKSVSDPDLIEAISKAARSNTREIKRATPRTANKDEDLI
jgi:hypothetical protein